MPDGRASAQTVGDLWRLSCRWKGQAAFLVDDEERLSGVAALSLTDGLAGGFAEIGLVPGARVAFLTASSVRHALAFFAAQQAGLVTCALHVLDTDQNIARSLEWLEADALLVDEANAPRLAAIIGATDRRVTTVALEGHDEGATDTAFDRLVEKGLSPLPHTRATHDDSLIVMSSGTTGEPKGVVHTHASVLASAAAGPFIYDCTQPTDSTIVVMAPSFAAWLYVVLPFVAIRGTIVFRQRFSPETFVGALAEERVTMAPLVPTAWRMIVADTSARAGLPNLRVAFYSGEAGSKSLVDALAGRFGCDIRTAYLSSEGGCASACAAGTSTLVAGGKPSSTGRPIPFSDMRVVDPEGGVDEAREPGATGEILLASESVASRYWKAPELTKRRFLGRWWRSGDLGMVDADGDVFVQGRTDNVINTGGIKVHAEEVEAALLRHPEVAMAAVVGPADPTWGQRIEAHVVLKSPVAEAEARLLQFCRETAGLSGPKIPKNIVVQKSLPTGPTGKLFRRGLLDEA